MQLFKPEYSVGKIQNYVVNKKKSKGALVRYMELS